MTPDPRFTGQPRHFWANVRTIGQAVGYTVRGRGLIKVPTSSQIQSAYSALSLSTSHLLDPNGKPTSLGRTMLEYFSYRAQTLNDYVEPRLMDADRARDTFSELKAELRPTCPLPMNKQKGNKRAHAYFTGIINMLIEANAAGFTCDYDPRELTTVTHNGAPLRTLARRIDGAFPKAVNPLAVWEIKEYYYTTTFGSRVADGVYETLLDGMELEELFASEGRKVLHYLFVDAHYTWWDCGRSYLCRILDMLHMGFVDDVLFGYEVVERLPSIVKGWTKLAAKQPS
ncbi:MAG: hypothetical protein KJ749_08805 [Planctomycetes bacterium]|nr:hypothetical protein [Planctomycetota bacterium]